MLVFSIGSKKDITDIVQVSSSCLHFAQPTTTCVQQKNQLYIVCYRLIEFYSKYCVCLCGQAILKLLFTESLHLKKILCVELASVCAQQRVQEVVKSYISRRCSNKVHLKHHVLLPTSYLEAHICRNYMSNRSLVQISIQFPYFVRPTTPRVSVKLLISYLNKLVFVGSLCIYIDPY